MYLPDPRDYQILFLTFFLLLGMAERGWTFHPEALFILMLACLGTQVFLSQFISRLQAEHNPTLLNCKSALITALGLCLLLRSAHWSTLAIAGVLAISSKFLLRVEKKHVFNPANFGIIAVLTCTQDAWVSPGQWGEESGYVLLFLGLGGLILKKVGRWDTTAMFLGSYALLEIIRNVYLGWSGDVVFHRLTSGSLLLFAFFMITDPRSIPNSCGARLVWAIGLAVLTFMLRNQFFISSAPFLALFMLSPVTILLDRYWQAPRFTWVGTSQLTLSGH
jgi:Na+-transporting NADH:ubiquinone oxidoreductase subunit NqrB